MADWRRERRELMDYLLAQDWDVFGTLKFVDGRTIGMSSQPITAISLPGSSPKLRMASIADIAIKSLPQNIPVGLAPDVINWVIASAPVFRDKKHSTSSAGLWAIPAASSAAR